MDAERSYWEERLAAGERLSGVGWLGLGEPFNRWMYRVRRRVFLRRIGPLVRGQAPAVLDVGTGSGFYVERWQELGAGSITGADLTHAAVGSLGERFPAHRFVRLDIGAPDGVLPGEAFGAVSAMDMSRV